jgi:hypothetical protein
VLAHVRGDERADAAAGDEAVGGWGDGDGSEEVIEQPALDPPQARLGSLEQAMPAAALGDPAISIVKERLDVGGGVHPALVGEPGELADPEAQVPSQLVVSRQREDREQRGRTGDVEHGRLRHQPPPQLRRTLFARDVLQPRTGRHPPGELGLAIERRGREPFEHPSDQRLQPGRRLPQRLPPSLDQVPLQPGAGEEGHRQTAADRQEHDRSPPSPRSAAGQAMTTGLPTALVWRGGRYRDCTGIRRAVNCPT